MRPKGACRFIGRRIKAICPEAHFFQQCTPPFVILYTLISVYQLMVTIALLYRRSLIVHYSHYSHLRPLCDLRLGDLLDGDERAVPDPDAGVHGAEAALAQHLAHPVRPLEALRVVRGAGGGGAQQQGGQGLRPERGGGRGGTVAWKGQAEASWGKSDCDIAINGS